MEGKQDELAVDIGGRKVVAFVTVEEAGELVTIYPIPVGASEGFTFSDRMSVTRTVDVHGVQNAIGRRIAEKYENGDLPADTVSWELINDE